MPGKSLMCNSNKTFLLLFLLLLLLLLLLLFIIIITTLFEIGKIYIALQKIYSLFYTN